MSLEAVSSIQAVRHILDPLHRDGRTIGLVPTMGALHAGHAALVDAARADCDCVVVTVFVNPLQFGPEEDFERYPRNPGDDVLFCEVRQVDCVFAPRTEEIYPESPHTFVEPGPEAGGLCGAGRPGHFRGVATVVLKLVNIVQPARAYFGEKDFQQLVVLRRMVADLNVPVEVIAVPTVREPDGLAVSSRNAYLNSEERRAAGVVYRALRVMRQRIADGDRSVAVVRAAGLKVIELEPLVEVEYLETVNPEDLQPVTRISKTVRVLTAVRIGSTRLIDNIECEPGTKARRRRS